MNEVPPTARSDKLTTTTAQAWLRALETVSHATRDPRRTLSCAVTDWARKYGDATALVSEQENFSFRTLELRMN